MSERVAYTTFGAILHGGTLIRSGSTWNPSGNRPKVWPSGTEARPCSRPTEEVLMSRSIIFAKAGGPEVLEYIETQASDPGPHEVRIKVKAIGLNRAESMWRKDKYVEPV